MIKLFQRDIIGRQYQNRDFDSKNDRNSGRLFEDIEVVGCRFISCGLSITKDPSKRSIVRSVRVVNCEQIGSAVDAAIIEDTIVQDFKSDTVFHTRGAAFKHVTLKGDIDRIMTSPLVAPGFATSEQQRRFDEANARYYTGVDWALDISQAHFVEATVRGVPADLIRRDPETQAIVTREAAQHLDWTGVDLSGTWFDRTIEHMLEEGYSDAILIAPKRHKNFGRFRQAIADLRDAGIAQPG